MPATRNPKSFVSRPSSGESPKTVAIILRMPVGMLEQIDAAVRARPIRIPRQTWILEVLYEKLSRGA